MVQVSALVWERALVRVSLMVQVSALVWERASEMGWATTEEVGVKWVLEETQLALDWELVWEASHSVSASQLG
jgi:hypothetical protein